MFPQRKVKGGQGKESEMVKTYKRSVNVVLSLNATARAFTPSASILLNARLHHRRNRVAEEEKGKEGKNRKKKKK